jgi:hypothetical protein
MAAFLDSLASLDAIAGGSAGAASRAGAAAGGRLGAEVEGKMSGIEIRAGVVDGLALLLPKDEVRTMLQLLHGAFALAYLPCPENPPPKV